MFCGFPSRATAKKRKKGRPPSPSACGSCRPKMQSEAHSFLKEAKNREKVKTPKPDPQGKTRHCATQRESVVLPVSKRLKKPFRFKRHKAKQQKARCVLYELLRKSYSKLLEVRQGSALRLFDSFRELTGSIKEDRRIKPLNRSRERLQKSRLHGLQDRHENIDLHSQDFGRRGRHAHARAASIFAPPANAASDRRHSSRIRYSIMEQRKRPASL